MSLRDDRCQKIDLITYQYRGIYIVNYNKMIVKNDIQEYVTLNKRKINTSYYDMELNTDFSHFEE